MNDRIRESDWKLLRQLRAEALEHYCQRVLDEIGQLGAQAGKSSHERYLAVYRQLKKRDKQLAQTFDEPSRSRAVLQLAIIQTEKLLTDEEFARFSEETRSTVQAMMSIYEGE